MTRRFEVFSKEEEETIMSRMKELTYEGSTLIASYEVLSKEINKDAHAIKRRYTRLRKDQDEEDTTRDYRKAYSDEEDAIVYSRISAAKAAGIDLTVAYTTVADELGRPYGSVVNRWGKLKNKMSSSDSSVVGQGSMMMVKLKGLIHEASTFREKENKYKSKIRDLERDLSSTQKELSLIKNEYEKILSELSLVFNA